MLADILRVLAKGVEPFGIGCDREPIFRKNFPIRVAAQWVLVIGLCCAGLFAQEVRRASSTDSLPQGTTFSAKIEKSATLPQPLCPGSTITYQVTLTNQSSPGTPDLPALIADPIRSGTTYVAGSATNGAVFETGQNRVNGIPSSLSDFRGHTPQASLVMANRFKVVDRETPYLFPPSVQEWLPETHLARFVVEVVSKLELRKLEDSYTKRGSEGYHPAMMLALLFYGYATGVFSSRKLEQASYDSVAFRYLAGNTHPDHDTLAHFRKRFLQELKPLFVEILLLAQAMGFLKLGRVSLDGTKVKANASKHSALRWGHIRKLEARLREEVEELMRLAEAADGREETEGMDIPAELARREERLKAIEEAKQKLAQRAAERQAGEQAEYEAKVAKRQAQRKRGNKPRGRPPNRPKEEFETRIRSI